MTIFKVVDADGGVFNHVKYSASERDTDVPEVTAEKRRAKALHKKQDWLTKYNPNLQLSIVECDDFGTPLGKAPAVKSRGRAP